MALGCRTNKPVRCVPCSTVHCSFLPSPCSTQEALHSDHLGNHWHSCNFTHLCVHQLLFRMRTHSQGLAASRIGFMRRQRCHQRIRIMVVPRFVGLRFDISHSLPFSSSGLDLVRCRLAMHTRVYILAATSRSSYKIGPDLPLLPRSLVSHPLHSVE